jgi:hypothetical protein
MMDSLSEIQDLVQLLSSKVNVQDLLAVVGTKQDLSPDASKTQSEAERKRGLLVDALLIEAKAICKAVTGSEPISDEYKGRMKDIGVLLHKLLSSSDSKLKQFKMAESELLGLWASLIKLTIEDSTDGLLSKETEQKIVKLYHKLNWNHAVVYTEGWTLRHHPPDYLPF